MRRRASLPPANTKPGRRAAPRLAASLVAAALTALCACNNSSGSLFSSRMSIVSVFPARNATAVPENTAVQVRFSAAVDLGTVNLQTLRIQGGMSGTPGGTFSLAQSDRLVTFTLAPDTQFAFGETVTVRVTSDVLGKSGVSAESEVFTFVIRDDPDVGTGPAPQVTNRTPAPHTTQVDSLASVEIVFDLALDPTTVTADTAALVGSLSGPIPADLTLSDDNTVLTLSPQRDYLALERIRVVLSTGLRSADGVAFSGETFSFAAVASSQDPLAEPLSRAADIVLGGVGAELVAADLDMDGVLDLVVRMSSGDALRVLRGLGGGTFEFQADIEPPTSALSLAVIDIDGAGSPDIVVGLIDRLVLYQLESADGGNLAYGDPVEVPVGAAVRAIAAANLDHVGARRADLVLDTDGGLQIYLDGPGGGVTQSFGSTRRASSPLVLADLAVSVNDDGDGGVDVPVDGWLDLAFGAAEGDELAVHLSLADGGAFDELIAFPLPSDARQVLVEDFDGDGLEDLLALVALPEGLEVLQFVSLSAATGGAGGTGLLPGLAASSLTAADVDADGWTDLLVSNPESARVGWLRNAEGVLDLETLPLENLLTGVPAQSTVAHDFTGDGKIDILALASDRIVPLVSESADSGAEVSLAVADASAEVGSSGIPVAVRSTHDRAISSFTALVAYDVATLAARSVPFEGTATAAADAEFTNFEIDEGSGTVRAEATIDVDPHDGKTLPPASDSTLFEILFDVPGDASPGMITIDVLAESGGHETRFEDTDAVSLPWSATSGIFTVLPRDPTNTENRLAIGSATAHAADTGVRVPVRLTNQAAIDGFTVTIQYPAGVLLPAGVDLEGSITASRVLFFENFDSDATAGWVTYNAVLSPLVADNVLPPGTDQVLFHFVFDVAVDASPGGSPLAVLDPAPNASLETMLVSGGFTAPVETSPGTFTVEGPRSNTVVVSDAMLARGDKDARLDVRITNESPIDRITLVFDNNPAALEIVDVDLAGTVSEPLSPSVNRRFDPATGEVAVDLLFRSILGGEAVAAGSDQLLLRLVLDIFDTAPLGETSVAIAERTADSAFRTRLVSDAMQESLERVDGTITIENRPGNDNPNKLRVADRFAQQGQTRQTSAVFMTSTGELAGFTITGRYPAAVMQALAFSHAGTAIELLNPEFVAPEVDPSAETFSYTAIFDFFLPLGEGKIVPASTDLRIVDLVYDVPADAAVGDYEIRLENVFGPSRQPNSLIFDLESGTESVFPEVTHGALTVGVPQVVFVRGDVDLSGTIGNADHEQLLLYLARGEQPPLCMDAADVDDSGVVDPDDLLFLLDFVFRGTPVPPPPLPGNPAPDPTADELDCQQGL